MLSAQLLGEEEETQEARRREKREGPGRRVRNRGPKWGELAGGQQHQGRRPGLGGLPLAGTESSPLIGSCLGWRRRSRGCAFGGPTPGTRQAQTPRRRRGLRSRRRPGGTRGACSAPTAVKTRMQSRLPHVSGARRSLPTHASRPGHGSPLDSSRSRRHASWTSVRHPRPLLDPRGPFPCPSRHPGPACEPRFPVSRDRDRLVPGAAARGSLRQGTRAGEGGPARFAASVLGGVVAVAGCPL